MKPPLNNHFAIVFLWFSYGFSASARLLHHSIHEVIPSSLQLGVSTSIVFTFRLLNAADRSGAGALMLSLLVLFGCSMSWEKKGEFIIELNTYKLLQAVS